MDIITTILPSPRNLVVVGYKNPSVDETLVTSETISLELDFACSFGN